MLRKFVSSLLVLSMLAGCSSGKGSEKKEDSASEKTTTESAADIASEIVSKLSLGEKTVPVKDRIILGMVFGGEQITTDAAMYLSGETGNSDTVGVFVADDMKACKEAVDAYLVTQKANAETYNADQVFKISNAVIVNNDKMMILVVCDDIESAKKTAMNYID